MHKPLCVEKQLAPSAAATEHHGKPALLRGTLVSRGSGWRVTSLLVDTGGPENRRKPTDSSLPTSHSHLPLPGTPPGCQHQSITSFWAHFFQKTQPSLLTGQWARAGPEW